MFIKNGVKISEKEYITIYIQEILVAYKIGKINIDEATLILKSLKYDPTKP